MAWKPGIRPRERGVCTVEDEENHEHECDDDAVHRQLVLARPLTHPQQQFPRPVKSRVGAGERAPRACEGVSLIRQI